MKENRTVLGSTHGAHTEWRGEKKSLGENERQQRNCFLLCHLVAQTHSDVDHGGQLLPEQVTARGSMVDGEDRGGSAGFLPQCRFLLVGCLA